MGFRQPVGPMALDLSWVMELVLVCSSCPNQIPQTGWLKQRIFSFSQFRILEVQDQGASKFNSWWKHSSCIVVHHLLSVSSHNISSGYVWRKRERDLWYLFLSKGYQILWDQGPTLTTSVCAVLGCSVVCDTWHPMNSAPPGCSAMGILQARTLEWVAMPSSRGSSRHRGRTQVSPIAGGFFTI